MWFLKPENDYYGPYVRPALDDSGAETYLAFPTEHDAQIGAYF